MEKEKKKEEKIKISEITKGICCNRRPPSLEGETLLGSELEEKVRDGKEKQEKNDM